jgi:tRNA pseudouridine13 synthase
VAIRRSPDDFRVDEELVSSYASALESSPSEDAPFAVCRLTKSGWTTPDAVDALTRELHLPPRSVTYAGLKDRHAATAQHISLDHPPLGAVRSLARGVEGEGWRARTIGWSARPLDASCIASNTFEIVVRGLVKFEVELMRSRADDLADANGALLFVNYFGDQRFGSARHGKGFAARPLIAGNPLGALRLAIGTPARKDSGMQRAFTRLCAAHWGNWKRLAAELPECPDRRPFERLATGSEPDAAFMALRPFLRGMCIEAYQSYLWNEGARRMVRALPAQEWRTIEAADDFGPLLFPRPTEFPASWLTCEAPMLSPETEFAAPWGDAWQEAITAEGLTTAALVVPGIAALRFGHALRPLLARAAGLVVEPDVDDSTERGSRAVSVRFSLPRGAYATVVLRALGQ